jgi:parvulin-like peptidyl-prolyl isomerase
MIRKINKHQRWLMIVIAILAIPFVFYFNKTDFSAQRSDKFASIYGRTVTLTEARRYARICDLARQLGMFAFLQDLTAGAQTQEGFYAQFALNLIILRHEADRLGIRPSDAEIIDIVRNMRTFRGPSGFDAKKYDEFTQSFLSPNGFSDAEVKELAGDEIALNKIRQLVAAGVSISEAESKANFEQLYGKMTVSVARLRTDDIAKGLKINDEDVQKYYEAHKAELNTDEKRKAEFVSLAFTEEQKKLAGKERIDVLQKLADRANDFTQALLEKGADFKQTAAKFQTPVRETAEFTQLAPDPQLKDPQLAATVFQLTQQEPNSEPVQTTDGFYIFHLTGIAPARPLTLEEAKPKVVEAIKTSRSREIVSNKGATAAHDLRESLKSGAPLAFSWEKASLKPEKIPPFALADEVDSKIEPNKKESADLPAIKNAVGDLNAGDVSEFFPTDDGGLIAVVEKREPPDEAKVGQNGAAFEERYVNNKRRIVFYEWLRERQREAGLATAPETQPAAAKQGS